MLFLSFFASLAQYFQGCWLQLDLKKRSFLHVHSVIYGPPIPKPPIEKEKWITPFKFRFSWIIRLYFCLQSTTFDCIIGVYVTAHWIRQLNFNNVFKRSRFSFPSGTSITKCVCLYIWWSFFLLSFCFSHFIVIIFVFFTSIIRPSAEWNLVRIHTAMEFSRTVK